MLHAVKELPKQQARVLWLKVPVLVDVRLQGEPSAHLVHHDRLGRVLQEHDVDKLHNIFVPSGIG